MDQNQALASCEQSEDQRQTRVSGSEFDVVRVGDELAKVVKKFRSIPEIIKEELEGARIAGKYRGQLERVLSEQVGRACQMLEDMIQNVASYQQFGRGLFDALRSKGIESMDDLNDFMSTTEMDGEVVAAMCAIFNKDVSQAREVLGEVRSLHEVVMKSKESPILETMDTDIPEGQNWLGNEVPMRDNNDIFQTRTSMASRATPIGRVFEPHWKPLSEHWDNGIRRQDQGQDSLSFLAMMQASACVNPGVYKGKRSECFDEFIRRFNRKYRSVIRDERTLIDILGDDHLDGRAKSIFLSLPREIKERGFEAVVEELGRLMASDSAGGRLRALTELRNLKRRAGQSVSEFCVVLEKLGRQANPSCDMRDRSMEFAQILLENLSDWPEQVQLMSALYRVDPKDAYDAVKQLALTIEQSKLMFGVPDTRHKEEKGDWRKRFAAYQGEEVRTTENRGNVLIQGFERVGRRPVNPEVEVRKPIFRGEPTHHEGRELRTAANEGRPLTNPSREQRKCYNCSKTGHIGRDCPLKKPRVNQIAEAPKPKDVRRGPDSMSQMIHRARNLGIRAKDAGRGLLVGEIWSAWAKMLSTRVRAVLVTGSMISIIPIKVLAQAQSSGFDVDSLEMIQDAAMVPVYDASGNRMEFMGAVKIEVELEGGKKAEVAFHVLDSKEEEILLGTNSLEWLGVQLQLSPEEQKEEEEATVGKVIAAKRAYIAPRAAAIVSARCEGHSGKDDRIIWPRKNGLVAGVYRIRGQEVDMPIINNSDEPMICKEGEEIGQWGTEKWREGWEDVNPLDRSSSNRPPKRRFGRELPV